MADAFDVRALVPAVLQHDDEAARELVRQLHPLVAKIVRSHRPRRAAEEDLCQMIFIRIFQKLPQFSGAVPLQHWVSRIAVNTCLNQLSSEKARPELRRADLSAEEAAVIDNLAATSDEVGADAQLAARDLVEHLLGQLQPADRLVVDLMYLQGKSVNEIRKVTGWSKPLVKVRAFRARQKLKDHFSRMEQKEIHGAG